MVMIDIYLFLGAALLAERVESSGNFTCLPFSRGINMYSIRRLRAEVSFLTILEETRPGERGKGLIGKPFWEFVLYRGKGGSASSWCVFSKIINALKQRKEAFVIPKSETCPTYNVDQVTRHQFSEARHAY